MHSKILSLAAVSLLLGCGSPATLDDGGAERSDDDGGADRSDAAIGSDAAPATDVGPQPGGWQLPAGHFVPAKMPIELVHPRPEASPEAYCRNAHPGVRWEIPIVIQGGAWPFQHRIVDDGAASGIRIGAELSREVRDGFVHHEVTEDYGVLSWDDPVEGTYAIEVLVTDQEGEELTVEVDLTVGTAGWVFIDAELGDDDSGTGTVDAPFRTLGAVHDAGTFADQRAYLAGVVRMDSNRDNGSLRIEPGLAPRAWVGWPGREAVLEAYEGQVHLAAPDFYLANIEHRHAEDWFPAPESGPLHMFTVWEDTSRFTMHDVTFSRFQGTPNNTGLGNSSIMMFVNSGDRRSHIAVVNCTQTGPNGTLTSTYDMQYAVFEKNRAVDADMAITDGSTWANIYIKGATNEYVTIRANRYATNNEWRLASAIGLLHARDVEIAYNVVDIPYDSGRRGALKLWTNSSAADFSWDPESVFIYRNSLRRRISYEGDALANMPDGTVIVERNVLALGEMPASARIVDTDNSSEGDLLDDEMRLREQTHLGRRGAEVAAPE